MPGKSSSFKAEKLNNYGNKTLVSHKCQGSVSKITIGALPANFPHQLDCAVGVSDNYSISASRKLLYTIGKWMYSAYRTPIPCLKCM